MVKAAADTWNPAANVPPIATVQRPESGTYTIAKGDTPETIANRFGVSWKRLAESNPGLSPRRMSIGGSVNIPISDREWIIKEHGFDPEQVVDMEAGPFYKQLLQESQMGRYMRPIGAPSGNTSRGWFQANRGMFNAIKNAYPQWFGNYTHEDMDDFSKAAQVRLAAAKHYGRQYQYLNRKPATQETLVRQWYAPNNPYGEAANKYWNDVNKHTMNEVFAGIRRQPPEIYKIMTGRDKQ